VSAAVGRRHSSVTDRALAVGGDRVIEIPAPEVRAP
jgi:hypothetical protein